MGHAFISFNKSVRNKSVCESTTACSARTKADGWNVYKKWDGAFSASHADEVPACDRPVTGDYWVTEACATQVTVRGNRNLHTCTSCNPGYAFVMQKGATRTGKCQMYEASTKVACAIPQSNARFDHSTAQAKLCTKWLQAQLLFNVDQMEDEGARAHYAHVMGGQWGMAVPFCNVRKETVCDADGSCDVQKTVQCVKVCRLKSKEAPWRVDNCRPALCKGEYGQLACHDAAMME